MSDNNDNERELPNGMKLVFAPGCFDHFEGTQEELDALINEIEEAFANGDALVNVVELGTIEDLIDSTDPEEIEEIVNQMTSPRTLQ